MASVLLSGPSVPSAGTSHSKTSESEQRLGLQPSVYLYLGKTREIAAEAVLVLPMDTVNEGYASPFDTGALVWHANPVKDWEDYQRRAYLRQYTWTVEEFQECLEAYPSAEPSDLGNYIVGRRPPVEGPHRIFSGRMIADIWSHDSGCDWRIWTWEWRTEGSINIKGKSHKWSCPPDRFREFEKYAATGAGKVEDMEFLLERYVKGGASQLMLSLRAIQGIP